MKRTMLLAAGLLLLTACNRDSGKMAGETATKVGGNMELPMLELMVHVVDPAAWAFWGGAGTESSAAGERDLSPTTEEGWKKVEDGAAMLVEAGNLLKLEGRVRKPEAKWRAHADTLSRLAVQAKEAAEIHDKNKIMEIGILIDTECDACHADFRPAPKE